MLTDMHSKKKWPYEGKSTIRVVVKENPKRIGSQAYACFALYNSGMTVDEYSQKCRRLNPKDDGRVRITWDLNHKFIEVTRPRNG